MKKLLPLILILGCDPQTEPETIQTEERLVNTCDNCESAFGDQSPCCPTMCKDIEKNGCAYWCHDFNNNEIDCQLEQDKTVTLKDGDGTHSWTCIVLETQCSDAATQCFNAEVGNWLEPIDCDDCFGEQRCYYQNPTDACECVAGLQNDPIDCNECADTPCTFVD